MHLTTLVYFSPSKKRELLSGSKAIFKRKKQHGLLGQNVWQPAFRKNRRDTGKEAKLLRLVKYLVRDERSYTKEPVFLFLRKNGVLFPY